MGKWAIVEHVWFGFTLRNVSSVILWGSKIQCFVYFIVHSYGAGFIIWNIDNNFCPSVR